MRHAAWLVFAVTLQAAGPAHPRLYLTPDRIATLRQEAGTVRKAQWDILRAQADQLSQRHPPKYEGHADDPGEQLWQREVGNALPTLAMAWVITGNQKYRNSTQEWAAASCSYPTWGNGPTNKDTDLSAGHQLFGLAMVLDWMYADLDPALRENIHRTLLAHARIMYSAADPKTGRFWKDEFLQNHLWVNMAGLAAAALAIPEEPEAAKWLALAQEKFRRTEDALGPDGASHEGVGYWSYGVEYMLKFWALSADLLGEDLHSPWWRKTALYRIYMGIPRNAWTPKNTIVDIADCPRQDYYGPDYLLFNLARRFHDPYAQGLALEIERANVGVNNTAPFLNLLWFDPKQPESAPATLPTMHHFDDIGIVSARSDWSGREALVVFKSGPPAGHDEVRHAFPRDPGFGHVHPDANHFVVFANGQWIIQDDGYRWKETGQHNTLLVDGIGQMGEHYQWFGRKPPLPLQGEPTILKAESNADYDLMIGDATGAYAPQVGLRRYVRRVIFWKAAAAVLAIDDIEADHARNLELRFHPVETAGARIEDLTPQNVQSDQGIIEGKDRDGKPFPQFTLRMRTNAAKWFHVTSISWPAGGKSPVAVTMKRDGDQLTFEAGGKTLQLPLK